MEPDFFTQVGLDHLPDDEKQELATQLGEVALTATEKRCQSVLNRKQRKTYEKLAQTNPDAALELLEQAIPNFLALVNDEMVRLCRETLDTQAAVMKRLGAR